MRVNININTATDLKMTMKKHEFVVEEQSTQGLSQKGNVKQKLLIKRIGYLDNDL